MKNPKIFLNRNMATSTLDIHLHGMEDGRRYVALPPMIEQVQPGEYTPPMISLDMADRETLQELADELAWLGITPKSAQGHQGELAAVRYHLEDMRNLAKVK